MNSSYRVDFGKREYRSHAKGAKRSALLFSICSSSGAISIENFHGNGLPQAILSLYLLVPPEIVPLDFFFWKYIKSVVYVTPLPTTLPEIAGGYKLLRLQLHGLAYKCVD
jgi:hypothetical protein